MAAARLLPLAAGLLALAAGPARAGFMTLDVPGGVDTFVSGIGGNLVVGNYFDPAAGKTRGFVYDRAAKSFTPLDVPGAAGTSAQGVSGTTVVGGYDEKVGTKTVARGFSYDLANPGAGYTLIDVPGASSTTPLGVNGATVVGSFRAGGNTLGFISDGTTFTPVDAGAALGGDTTNAAGVNAAGLVVGSFFGGTFQRGFVYDPAADAYTAFDAPDPADPSQPAFSTTLAGIDGATVAGSFIYFDPAGSGNLLISGFTSGIDGTGFRPLDYPGRTFTFATGVSGDVVVGYYYKQQRDGTVGPAHGFVLSSQSVPEPASVGLLAAGGAALLGVRLRRRKGSA